MRRLVTTAFFVLALSLGLASSASAQVSVAIRIGPPPPPRVVRVLPPRPGPEFIWVQGYWYPVGRRYVWHNGYWTRPPYEGAVWVQPRYNNRAYYPGYWEGSRGRLAHEHGWDRSDGRDFGHDRGRGRARGHGRD